MVPTRRFWLLVAMGIPVAIVAGATGGLLLLIAYNVALVAIAWVTALMGPDPRRLAVVRTFDPVLSVRVPNKITVTIENTGAEPMQGLFRDEPPLDHQATQRETRLRVEPGRESVFQYSITPNTRGSDFFRGSFVRLDCPLGLVRKQAYLNTSQVVRVYPNVLALREFDLLKHKGKLDQIGIRKSRIKGLGTEFESLRDYAEGDDYRKIDWKATARRGKLVVRQFEQERNQPVILVVDVGRKMLADVNGVSKLDHVLDASLMLSHAAMVSGDLVGLLVYSDTVRRYVPPRKGRNQAGVIVDAIHDLTAEPLASSPQRAFSYLGRRWSRRALIVLFTEVEDEDDARNLTAGLRQALRRHLTLVVRVADPDLLRSAAGRVESEEDLFQKAASLQFVNGRQKAGSLLDAGGFHSLETEPQDLAAALVSFYFQVKERSLL